ncbi:MAG: hypothetical protein ACK4IS_13360 [Erythrobacter sp.]
MQAALPIMIGMTAISSIVGAAGTMAAGNQNAAVARAKARETQAQGVAERGQIRDAARAAMGRQVMQAAESGFTPGFGSALVELEESLINRELDLMTSRRNADAAAAGLEQQAKFAKREAAFGAVATLTQGASQIFGAINADRRAGR